jgi:hypothetical protein
MNKKYFVTMYENEWEEYDSFGLRHYLDRVVIKSKDKLSVSHIKELVLNQYNAFRREEDQSEYDLDQLTFDIVDLEETETIDVISLEEKEQTMNSQEWRDLVLSEIENMSSDDFADFILGYFGEEYLFELLKNSLDEEENIEVALDYIKEIKKRRETDKDDNNEKI